MSSSENKRSEINKHLLNLIAPKGIEDFIDERKFMRTHRSSMKSGFGSVKNLSR
jgi:hypothetical protein